jgi:hypothetical protein
METGGLNAAIGVVAPASLLFEDEVGTRQADVLEDMIAKLGQASSDPALLAPSPPVPQQHGSEAE